jgi:pimeloyl-ACP methyl ester carboxylesterase
MSHADGQQTLGLFLRRRVTVLLAVLGMTATVLTGGAGSARGSIGTGRVPALHWSVCGGGFECASLAVPLDYDHPRGDTTSLALIRLPAADQRHRIGSLLINPGGPGTSGVERVREGARQRLPQVVRDRFDVVGFDPRGGGLEQPYPLLLKRGSAVPLLRRRAAVPVVSGRAPRAGGFHREDGRTRRYLPAKQRRDHAAHVDRKCGPRHGREVSHAARQDALQRLRSAATAGALTYEELAARTGRAVVGRKKLAAEAADYAVAVPVVRVSAFATIGDVIVATQPPTSRMKSAWARWRNRKSG